MITHHRPPRRVRLLLWTLRLLPSRPRLLLTPLLLLLLNLTPFRRLYQPKYLHVVNMILLWPLLPRLSQRHQNQRHP